MSDTARTLTEIAVERLSADIVNGVLVPEQKLLIAELKERYDMGASPLREALSQLSSQGFVVADSRRGFRVAAISREDLEDITRLRQLVELAALRDALAAGDHEWELGIRAAFARLEGLAAVIKAGRSSAGAHDLEQAHRNLHEAFLAACSSQRMRMVRSILYDQAQRYRQLMLQKTSQDLDEFVDIHRQLVEAILSRNQAQACDSLAEHLDLTLLSVYPDAPAQAETSKTSRSTRVRRQA
ncbi:FCD domain-containing protein [Uliginosibacterium sediminicola]|uniref:FCD domain-containing protein n=1 Tax=Uliginosibacterium sediminicola TaxID=2024550 RepID=A0ABU9YXB6_9RHOO